MMPLCGPEGACRLFAVLVAAFCFSSRAGGVANAALSANMQLSSNAIKNPPPGGAVASAGSPVSAAPGSQQLLNDGGNKHPTGDSQQPFACTGDEDCNADEFCSAPAQGAGIPRGQVCLACRRRRKRCLRDAMCCPGNYCSNGICVPLDHNFNPGEIEETIVESFDHGSLDPHLKKTTSSSRLHHLKGQEGAICLRSSDCATGLCCARHFWSKICKPVLKEGQVCTKHRKKGSHGLEIFQRCYCGDGLACRLQRDHTLSNSANSSRLHTCQRH